MSARVYVEGGGSGRALKAKCREAFKMFFEAAGLEGRLPRVVPGGGRQETCDDFCTALNDPRNDAFIVLLVEGRDSFEALAKLDPEKVTAASPHAQRLVDVLRTRLQPPRARAR